jgi:CPA2 family monovalent cation:H+ antiporter-2
MLIAETRVTSAAAGEKAGAIRSVVAQVIAIAGTVMLGFYVLVLTATLLPSLPVLITLILLIVLIAWLLRRSFIRVYSKAQAALQETLSQPPARTPAVAAVPSVLHETVLEMVKIGDSSPAAGKLILELQLRTATGASIVAIERPGQNVLNPGPDEELQAGDQVVLFGNRAQLDAAIKALKGQRHNS